jgi:hypothetical protein
MDEQGVVRYRLRQIDYDGKDTRTSVAVLRIPTTSSSVQLFQNYPNPLERAAGPSLIAFTLPERATARVEVFDLLGRPVVLLADREFEAGRNALQLTAGSLAPGSYIYSLTTGSTRLIRRLSVLN